jgi:RNA polymerase sigma factor (sigma-70 family)
MKTGSELLNAFVLDGDQEAFSEFVERYGNLVFSIAKRRLSDLSHAEDVAQAVFFRIVMTRPRFSNEASVLSWLHRTTTNLAIDAWRAESRRQLREKEAVSMQMHNQSNPDYLEELSKSVDAALDGLGDKDREVILLRCYGRHRMLDVGQMLGISEGAAKMRVSRAIESLRSGLIKKDVICTAAIVSSFLTEKAISAIPCPSLKGLLSIKPQPIAPRFPTGFTSRRMCILGSAGIVCLTIYLLLPPSKVAEPTTIASSRNVPVLSPTNSLRRTVTAVIAKPTIHEIPAPARLRLLVLNSQTGEGLPGTKVAAIYFPVGGSGETYHLSTDSQGSVLIPESEIGISPPMNIFVTADGYVPKALRWGAAKESEYTMRLDPAMLLRGTVANEEGTPLEGVKIAVQGPSTEDPLENMAFHHSDAATVSNSSGEWECPFIPQDWEKVTVLLTKEDYAVTIATIPLRPAPLHTNLVIKRGFAVTGVVKSWMGDPIEGATVREFHEFGYRKLTCKTSSDGSFRLVGFSNPYNDPHFAKKVKLVIEADGFAPELQNVLIDGQVNKASFVLNKGNIFRGRVVDDSGNPVAGAEVRNAGQGIFNWQTQTDANGVFDWRSAPSDPLSIHFVAPGYEPLRQAQLVADGSDHEVRLRPLGRK